MWRQTAELKIFNILRFLKPENSIDLLKVTYLNDDRKLEKKTDEYRDFRRENLVQEESRYDNSCERRGTLPRKVVTRHLFKFNLN